MCAFFRFPRHQFSYSITTYFILNNSLLVYKNLFLFVVQVISQVKPNHIKSMYSVCNLHFSFLFFPIYFNNFPGKNTILVLTFWVIVNLVPTFWEQSIWFLLFLTCNQFGPTNKSLTKNAYVENSVHYWHT